MIELEIDIPHWNTGHLILIEKIISLKVSHASYKLNKDSKHSQKVYRTCFHIQHMSESSSSWGASKNIRCWMWLWLFTRCICTNS